MGFLIPSALAFAALALPIIIFYMLKLRRQPARVSSLMLWQQLLQDRQANAPWQRLKRNLLLLLQLLILALLVMALARPYFTVAANVQGNVVLLLDASASMQATDVLPSRFAAAQEAAFDLIDRLDANDAVTLIAVENTPRVLAATTTDRTVLRRALSSVQPSYAPANWSTALTLAAANAATLPDSTIVIISDGGLNTGPSPISQSPDFPISNLPITHIPIGHQAANQGLVALSLRDGPAGPELFLRAFNAGPEPARRLVEIQVNGRLFDARWLELPARGSTGLTLSGLPPATQRLQATLTGRDDLAADDTAWVVRSAAPTRVLLVGPGNLFLERALALLPNIDAQRSDPAQPLPSQNFDLTIFDRTVPPPAAGQPVGPLPAGNLLFIDPPGSTLLFQVSGSFTQTHLARLDTGHPLLNYVELGNLHVRQARAIQPPPWAETPVRAAGGPLLMAGQVENRRVAILSFDLHQSDLPLQIDFPILTLNLIHWLSPGNRLQQGQTLHPGDSFALPAASTADTLHVRLPTQESVSLSPDAATFSATGRPGIYQVFEQPPQSAEPTLLTEFAVNLLAQAETDTRPRQMETAPAGQSPTPAAPLTGRQEWWWPLGLAGLGVLLAEWWVYWRGDVR